MPYFLRYACGRPQILQRLYSLVENFAGRCCLIFIEVFAMVTPPNYFALGIKEQLIFPEIEYDKVDKVRGMDIIFVTTAKTDEEARELLTLFNMPFAK